MNQDEQSSEDVRELLREAGKRPPLPAADMAMIKAAARNEWEQMRPRPAPEDRQGHWNPGRLLAIAAVLLVTVLAAWWWKQKGDSPAEVIVATVEISSHEEAGLLVGSGLAAGTRIDAESPMAFRLVGGQSLRVAADSSLELRSAFELHLSAGAIYVDSGPMAEGEGIRIETSYGVIQDVGTQFEVRIGTEEQPLRIRVREGEVIMKSNGSSSVAAAGEELALQRDGSMRRDRIATFGDQWQWMEELAPPFVLDGSSFAAYLEWLARETGWQIEFEDETLRQLASEIVLYGSLEGASPQQSLETVFPGSGLAYRLAIGRLEILRK